MAKRAISFAIDKCLYKNYYLIKSTKQKIFVGRKQVKFLRSPGTVTARSIQQILIRL
jgi:hypothetical protein